MRLALNKWFTRIFSLSVVSACLVGIAAISQNYFWRQNQYLHLAAQLTMVGVLVVWCVWLARRPDEMMVKQASLCLVGLAVVVTYGTNGDWWSLAFELGVCLPCWPYFLDDDDDIETRVIPVYATGLTGTVEYARMHFSGILVEEYSPDWKETFSQVTTDIDGHFELPCASGVGAHYIKISWPGTRTVNLRVELSADAQPILIRLRPRKPRTP